MSSKVLLPALLLLGLAPAPLRAQTLAETIATLLGHPQFGLSFVRGPRMAPERFETLRPIGRHYAITEERCRLLVEPRPELMPALRAGQAAAGRGTTAVIALVGIDLRARRGGALGAVQEIETVPAMRVSAFFLDDRRVSEVSVQALRVEGLDDPQLARAMARLFALCPPAGGDPAR